ncbi:beta-lactamase family protein [Luteolibacter ambystomatis]|uniref:Beta-lactamase family protein n=1 Tax=Luteolibacter ambystomatis TaxID=2824561 RepID=A0A975G6Z1_9BACT|nr:serine hydrolase domain-containing protein [Luteolibacter ambystomatis]QUE49957.1 beta-lactamase family protein [Luteolibacter ambystomatis]
MVRCILILCASVAVSMAKEPLDVSADLAKLLENSQVPGMAAAAVLKGEVVAAGTAGVRKLDEPQKVELGDHFHVGSCTKSMTASLAAMIIADGKIGWDTKVSDVFKDFEIHPDYREATLRQMLSNSGGVPHELKNPSWDRNRSGPEQRKALVKDILSVKPDYTPGQGRVYSNGGFAIGGAALEKVTGRAWEDLMQERLFKPLGITSAGFGAPATNGKVDQPYGHHLVNGKLVAVNPQPDGDNPAAIGPAGTVYMSVLDFAKYAGFHLGDLKKGPLSQTQLDDLHRPVPPGDDYACGWVTTKRDWAGGATLTHNGSNTMFFAVMWLAPAKDFAVVAVCNSGDGAKVCDQAASLLIGKCVPK